jgi:hypothetical protein
MFPMDLSSKLSEHFVSSLSKDLISGKFAADGEDACMTPAFLREKDLSLALDGVVRKVSQVCPAQSEPAISRQRLRTFSKTSTGNVPASKASAFFENLSGLVVPTIAV